jgi:hypothetical protein
MTGDVGGNGELGNKPSSLTPTRQSRWILLPTARLIQINTHSLECGDVREGCKLGA